MDTLSSIDFSSTTLQRQRFALWTMYTFWGIALLCLVILFTQFHRVTSDIPGSQFFLFVIMGIVAEARPARLISGRLALTHAVGILAFVSSNESAFFANLIAIVLGSTIGVIFYERGTADSVNPQKRFRNIIEEVFSASSGFIISGVVFITLGGHIPTNAVQPTDFMSGVLIIAYAGLYSGLTGILFAMRQLSRGFVVARADRLRMPVMIIFPAMLSVLGGEVARATGPFGLVMLYIGTFFVLFLLYDLSNAEAKLRKDLFLEQAMSNENQRLYEEQSERVEQLALLNRVVGSLGGTLASDSLIEHLISSASILSNATGFAIYVQTNDRLELTRSVGLGDDFLFKAPPPLHIPNARKADAGQPLVIENLSADTRAVTLRAAKLDLKFQGMMELPMVAGGELIGIMSLFYIQGRLPTANQIDMLATFATQAAQALANARQYLDAIDAYQHRGERLLTLTWLSRTLSSSVDIESMCEQIVDVVLLATGAEIGAIFLVDEYAHHTSLSVGSQRGLPKNTTLTQALHEIAPFLNPERGSMIVYRENAGEDSPPFLSQHSQTLLISPMVQGGLLFGAIWLETSSATAFNAEDVQFIEQVSHQSLIVLENARLFQRIESDRDRLATLLDTMEEGLMMVDREGRIVIANPQISILGINPERLISKGYFEQLYDERFDLATRTGFNTIEEAGQFISDLTAAGVELPPIQYTVQTPTGTKQIERRIVPIQNENREALGAMLVFYDRTSQHELERSREELIHMIIHDLRSPLTAVTTSLKLIHATVPPDSKYWPIVESTTEVSRRAIRKILNRVNSMLDIAKIRSGKLSLITERVDLAHLVKTVLNELEPIAIDLRVRLEFEPAEGEPIYLNIDADKTERLLMNLIDNALKYSPSEGSIIVRVYNEGEGGAHQGFVRIDVIDEGPGIPSEYKHKLFESFVQVEGDKPRRGGVGLGLTFCKLVVDAHHGALWIEDNPGGGSIFALTLPKAAPLPELDESAE